MATSNANPLLCEPPPELIEALRRGISVLDRAEKTTTTPSIPRSSAGLPDLPSHEPFYRELDAIKRELVQLKEHYLTLSERLESLEPVCSHGRQELYEMKWQTQRDKVSARYGDRRPTDLTLATSFPPEQP
jgi:hypothetical protein